MPTNAWAPSARSWAPLPSLRPSFGHSGHPQGRPAVLCALWLGPLLGARQADRPGGRGPGARHRGAGAALRRAGGRPRPGRPRRGVDQRRALRRGAPAPPAPAPAPHGGRKSHMRPRRCGRGLHQGGGRGRGDQARRRTARNWPAWRQPTAPTRWWPPWPGRSSSPGSGPGDVRSIIAAGKGTPRPAQPGAALVVDLPKVPTRRLA